MVQIIQENRPRSTSEKFGQAFANVGQSIGKSIYEREQQKQQQAALAQEDRDIMAATGINLSGIRDPKTRQEVLASKLKGESDVNLQNLKGKQGIDVQNLKGQQSTGMQSTKGEQQLELEKLKHAQNIVEEDFKSNARNIEQMEKSKGKKAEQLAKKKKEMAPFQAALKTIEDMEAIGRKGNLGFLSSSLGKVGGERARDRKQYSQLGKSLIAMASTIPIRNQMEFDTLAHDLYNPDLLDSEREGILDAMKSIVTRSLEAFQEEGDEVPKEQEETGKVLDIEAMQNISELAKGNKDEARRIAKKMGYKI